MANGSLVLSCVTCRWEIRLFGNSNGNVDEASSTGLGVCEVSGDDNDFR